MRNDRELLLSISHGTFLWAVSPRRVLGVAAKAVIVLALGCLVCLVGCGGSNGSGGNNPPPTPIISVSGRSSVMVGQQAQYTATENGTSITPTWAVNNVTGGNSTVGTISPAGLYTAPQTVPSPAQVTITATSTGATAGAVSVTITPSTTPPPANPMINSFTAAPSTIPSGGSSTLSWTTTNAVSLSIDEGIGNVTPVTQGSVVVTPTQTTNLHMTATGAAGTTPATATATVTVTASGGITITSIVPASAYIETAGTLLGITINGSGFASGDILQDCAGSTPLGNGTLPNQISLVLAFQGNCASPGWLSFQVQSADGSEQSNSMSMAGYGTPATWPTIALSESTISMRTPPYTSTRATSRRVE